jgi:hypothetical protein
MTGVLFHTSMCRMGRQIRKYQKSIQSMKLTKMMLIAAMVAISLFTCNTSVLAQSGGGAGVGRGRGAMTSDALIARLQKALGETNKLSDAIVANVKSVLDDMMKKQADLRADTTIKNQSDRATKRDAITTAASDAIKAIVTPAQFAIMQPVLPQTTGSGGIGGGGGGAAPPAAGN